MDITLSITIKEGLIYKDIMASRTKRILPMAGTAKVESQFINFPIYIK